RSRHFESVLVGKALTRKWISLLKRSPKWSSVYVRFRQWQEQPMYKFGESKKGRVLVAMSGGVDSSVAAALLVEQGYDVIGATMQVWDYSADACDIQEGNGTCCSSTDVDDARAVADRLGIPFYVINCEAKFKAYVIDDFIGSYLEG